MIRVTLAALFLALSAVPVMAQDNYWVQIAARPTLAEATAYARDTSARLSGVHGFYLGNGFYAIAIGPFDRAQADSARARLLSSSLIPSDSFVKSDSGFDQQFWPIGGGIGARLGDPAPVQPSAPEQPVTISQIPDETPSQARASEAAMSQRAREELQRALQWAGFYASTIDGAFGRGTRAAMEQWQIANAAEPTGIMTTRQRARLMADYNAILDSLGMAVTRSDEAGIEVQLPTAVVKFREIQPPFVRYDESADVKGVKILLISQPGDDAQLRGLYEIMQSLDIIPLDGPRSLRGTGFEIEGRDADVHSYTQAALVDGQIKGFTLVWPAGDEARRQRVLDAMRASFSPLQGVLDPLAVSASADQSIDMVAGLEIRQPALSRSGFYVSQRGHVLTTTEVIGGCTRLTLDRDVPVVVQARDDRLGLALLVPAGVDIAPMSFAVFDETVPRLQSRVAVAGYPYEGALPAPTLTFGSVADLRNLRGDESQNRLTLAGQPGDAGGAILGPGGRVTGMMLPRLQSEGQILPEGVSFAVKPDEITGFLRAAGLEPVVAAPQAELSPVALTRLAADLGVLVSCW